MGLHENQTSHGEREGKRSRAWAQHGEAWHIEPSPSPTPQEDLEHANNTQDTSTQ